MAGRHHEEARTLFLSSLKNAQGAEELANSWELLLDKPAYRQFVQNWLILLDGHNPMPDLERYESLIRAAGHELAATEVLKPSNVFTMLFAGRVVHQEAYKALHILIAARLLSGPTIFTEQDLHVLYSSMDRILRGGSDWETTVCVPAATNQLYRGLASTSFPVTNRVTSLLNRMIESRGLELFGPRFAKVSTGALSPQLLLAAATALKQGRKTVSLSDAIEGAWAYLRFFDVDLRALPLVVREGKSGY